MRPLDAWNWNRFPLDVLRRRRVFLAALALLLAAPPLQAGEFEDRLARVDEALRKNPTRAPRVSLESCRSRRSSAIELYQMGQEARALRRLDFCMTALKIPEAKPREVAKVETVSLAEVQAQAAREVERALALEPDLAHGLEVYRQCAACHAPEGWGLSDGNVPQIAGQHRRVVIKQLADIRAGNRDAMLMLPYASVEAIGGAQAIADVAGYIDTLEISIATSKGPGDDLALGETLYAEQCASCHGVAGEGNADTFVPRIQSQHYAYLVRQFEWIREGKRRNANAEMAAQIQDFDERQTRAVLDYVSRLEPPEALQAPEGWRNPDFGG